jgi:hypothetical protein
MTWDPVSTGAMAYRDAAREIAERGASRVGTEGRNDVRADVEFAAPANSMDGAAR